MRIGSLFTGIGGLDWPWLGQEHMWLSEVDKDACKVLEYRFPGIPNLGDITTIDWPAVASSSPVDVLVGGGFPCQPFSVAGRRKGKADDRYLWPHVADAVAHLRPRLVVLENVPGILAPYDGQPAVWGSVLGSLAESGYECRWTTVRASDIGAPHQRARVFAVAYPERDGGERWGAGGDVAGASGEAGGEGLQRERGGEALGDPSPVTSDPPESRRQGADRDQPKVAAAARHPAPDSGGSRLGEGWDLRKGEPDVGPGSTSNTGRVGRRSRSGSRSGAPRGLWGDGSGDDSGAAVTDSGGIDRADRRLHGGREDREETTDAPGDRWGPYTGAVTRWERVHRPAPDPTDGGRLNPVFVEWMMGFPAGWATDLVPRRAALRMLGNAVVPRQAEAALEVLV